MCIELQAKTIHISRRPSYTYPMMQLPEHKEKAGPTVFHDTSDDGLSPPRGNMNRQSGCCRSELEDNDALELDYVICAIQSPICPAHLRRRVSKNIFLVDCGGVPACR
jgi:hypothetical protein